MATALQERFEGAFKAVKDWTTDVVQEHVVEPAREFSDTVNGQKVLNEVREYMIESELINTALVTRLLQVESRIRWLQGLVAILAVAETVHWLLR
jgi:hypothetical protein